jgi:hypothetical protein
MEEMEVSEILKNSTVPDDLPLFVSGRFASEDEARELGNNVMAIAKLVGSVFDLTALEGITVSDDYKEALRGIERGYQGMNAPTPTRDEFGIGQAMAVPVLRDGKHKSHVVVNAMLVRPLVDSENTYYQFAVHTLCHEFAHVYDHMLRSKALPRLYGSQMTDLREATLMQLAMAAWDEYAASRLSAPWGTSEYCSEFEQALVPMLDTMLARAESSKQAFAVHRNTEQTMSELREVFGSFLIRSAYLVGHIDGIDGSLQVEAPTLAKKIEETTWLKTIWSRYLEILREMFSKLEAWEGIETYGPLKELFETLLLRGGLQLSKLPQGGYYARFVRTSSL